MTNGHLKTKAKQVELSRASRGGDCDADIFTMFFVKGNVVSPEDRTYDLIGGSQRLGNFFCGGGGEGGR